MMMPKKNCVKKWSFEKHFCTFVYSFLKSLQDTFYLHVQNKGKEKCRLLPRWAFVFCIKTKGCNLSPHLSAYATMALSYKERFLPVPEESWAEAKTLLSILDSE